MVRFLFAISFTFFVFNSNAYAANSGQYLNPDISLNGLIHYQSGNRGNLPTSDFKNGWKLEELELRMTSNLDAYFRGDITLAVEKHPPETVGGEEEYHIEPEEAFVETLQLPAVTVRLGKYLLPFGKHNELHTHAFHFIDAPLTQSSLFGEHGLSETGLGAWYLVPTEWFMEFSAHINQAENEHVFGTGTKDDVMGLYQLKNLWDLSGSKTLEWTLGYAHGRDQLKKLNNLYSTSLTYKWRPVENSKSTSFSWSLESTAGQNTFDENGTSTGSTLAFSTWMMYQTHTRWWLQVRHEQLDYTDTSNDPTLKDSLLLAYVPTEFSALRLQYDIIDNPALTEKETRATFQMNFSMGAHPAHAY